MDPRRINLQGKILVSHQAEFMPWLGYISKAAMGDIYVILDDTQFKKKYFENRNKIRFPNKEGWKWLNIPVKNKDSLQNMLDVRISGNDWKKNHLKDIKTSYANAPFFDKYYPELEDIYTTFSSEFLLDFNLKIISYAFQKFRIMQPVYRLSEKINGRIKSKGNDMVVDLCKIFDANVLVAGISGKDYLDLSRFGKEDLKVVFQSFKHPEYSQIHGGFVPYMSFIDILFNIGEDAAIKKIEKSEKLL